MSYTKIVYQLLIAVRYLAFVPGLVLTILSVLGSDEDVVDISYGLMPFVMGCIQFLLMLVFACSFRKSLGVFLDESTYWLSLWIYLPEIAIISLLVKFSLVTDGDNQKLAIGATSAFVLAFLILLLVVCGQRVLRKDIPDDEESLLHKNARDSKVQKERTKQSSHQRQKQRKTQQQLQKKQIQNHHTKQRPNGVVQNGVSHPAQRPPAVTPKPQFSTERPSLQELVKSNNNNNNKRSASKRNRHQETPIYSLADMDPLPTRHSENFTEQRGDIYRTHGPPLRYTGNYIGPSPPQYNGHAPPLRYSANSTGPYDDDNIYTLPFQNTHSVAEQTAFGGRTRYAPTSRYDDLPPDY